MSIQAAANAIKYRVQQAAETIGASNPLPYVGGLLDRSFQLPVGDQKYAQNTLAPGTIPFEPSFSAREPKTLRFVIEPLGPGVLPVSRRDESTREMRRLVNSQFGPEALHWFDQSSEEWRSLFGNPTLTYGAWFGNSYDRDGLHSSKVYYEIHPNQINSLPSALQQLARTAQSYLPDLVPIFTTISCQRNSGRQRLTFLHWKPVRLSELNPLMTHLGLEHQMSAVMQVFGLSLGGRFSLPARSLFIGLAGSLKDPEVKLEVALGMLPDFPPEFLKLLTLGLAERPRELQSLQRWLQAFTPDTHGWPGQFSVLSVIITPHNPAKVSLYLRPIEFALGENQLANLSAKGHPYE
ncbi:MAG: hypothetical protein AAF821_08230 [Cyanobacteria bacterium P01_D01_bin.156]